MSIQRAIFKLDALIAYMNSYTPTKAADETKEGQYDDYQVLKNVDIKRIDFTNFTSDSISILKPKFDEIKTDGIKTNAPYTDSCVLYLT